MGMLFVKSAQQRYAVKVRLDLDNWAIIFKWLSNNFTILGQQTNIPQFAGLPYRHEKSTILKLFDDYFTIVVSVKPHLKVPSG